MILKKGSKGDKVRQLQLALDITADGIVGKETWKKLIGVE